MKRSARRLTLVAVAGIALSSFAVGSASAMPADGQLTVSPASGTSAAKSTFSTTAVCQASDTVSVLVSGGSGTGATVPAPGKVLNPAAPVSNYAQGGGGMTIPASSDWAAWATSGELVLTRLDGAYTVTAQCTNGEKYTGVITFTGTNVNDATYAFTAPTQTATATETKTATATTTAPETPIALPASPPNSNGTITVTGTPLAGGTITVEGGGFRPGSPITVGMYANGPVNLASAVAASDGKANSAVALPKGSAGKRELVMLGYAPDGKERALTAEITIIEAADVTVPATLPKSDGALTVAGATVPGGTITVSGSGFKPGSPIAVGIYSTGKQLTTAVADKNGNASTPVILPADYNGVHTLAMLGRNPQEALRTLTADVTIAPAPVPDSGVPWWVWLIGAIILLAIIGGIWASMAARKKRAQPWDDAMTAQAGSADNLADTVSLSISDRGRPAAEAITTWNTELPSMQAAEAQLGQLVTSAPDEARRGVAERLLGARVALREALGADVQLRSNESAPGQDALLGQSAAVVAQRRQELATAVAAVGPVLTAATHTK